MRENYFKTIFLFALFLLAIFQIKTTNIKEAYSFTPAQIDQQIQRMNEYPPPFGKLGYILEAKKEFQIANKFEENFFTAIDPREYFPDRIPYLFSPFVLSGLYFFIEERDQRKYLFYSFIFSILLLIVIGPFAKYGPILIYPFFLLFILMCFQRVFRFKWL